MEYRQLYLFLRPCFSSLPTHPILVTISSPSILSISWQFKAYIYVVLCQASLELRHSNATAFCLLSLSSSFPLHYSDMASLNVPYFSLKLDEYWFCRECEGSFITTIPCIGLSILIEMDAISIACVPGAMTDGILKKALSSNAFYLDGKRWAIYYFYFSFSSFG